MAVGCLRGLGSANCMQQPKVSVKIMVMDTEEEEEDRVSLSQPPEINNYSQEPMPAQWLRPGEPAQAPALSSERGGSCFITAEKGRSSEG